MAARKLCAKNGLIAENATTVRQFQSPPWIHACRKISTEESQENEDCNGRSFVFVFFVRPAGAGGARALPFRIHRKMFVLEMLRDPPGLFYLDFLARGIQLIVRFPAFRGAAHVSCGVS